MRCKPKPQPKPPSQVHYGSSDQVLPRSRWQHCHSPRGARGVISAMLCSPAAFCCRAAHFRCGSPVWVRWSPSAKKPRVAAPRRCSSARLHQRYRSTTSPTGWMWMTPCMGTRCALTVLAAADCPQLSAVCEQVRTEDGWLQGFITITSFTTWTRYFRRMSHPGASGT